MRRATRLLGQLLLMLVVFEALLHIYNPLPFRVRGNKIILPVHQRYTFHIENAAKLDRVVHHTKNSLGFRGPEPPRDFADRLTVLTIRRGTSRTG